MNALRVGRGKTRALIVNAGNANAFTGKAGNESVKHTVEEISKALECSPEEVYIASTGVIGEPLPHERITHSIPELVDNLECDAWKDASRAIMTTDTFPKRIYKEGFVDGVKVTINAIAKGSGMIAPNMATMLAFLFTDAEITHDALQDMLIKANEKSFNSITVDGDTSTNDTVMLFATGEAGNIPIAHENKDFQRLLDEVMVELAKLVVRDGEGASKFITINVQGAEDDGAAKRIGLSIGNSPLVKTAIAGEDANWGRIVMAVGKAGEKADRDALSIWIGDVLVAKQGAVCSSYKESSLTHYMQGDEITITVNVGIAEGKATVWTCDLTKGYIEINADYRS